MSRRLLAPGNTYIRKADPLPPLFDEPDDGDIYYNRSTGRLRIALDKQWYDVIGGESGIPVDHGALVGLGDDDHPQYHTDARGDDRYQRRQAVMSPALTAGAWYRIAVEGPMTSGGTGGARAEATFRVYDTMSGRHGFMQFTVISAFGATHLTVDAASHYGGSGGCFTQVRVVDGSTYDGTAIEVFAVSAVNAGSAVVEMLPSLGFSYGFTLQAFTAGSVPSGFQAREINVRTTSHGILGRDSAKPVAVTHDGNLAVGDIDLNQGGGTRANVYLNSPTANWNGVYWAAADRYLTCDGEIVVADGNVNLKPISVGTPTTPNHAQTSANARVYWVWNQGLTPNTTARWNLYPNSFQESGGFTITAGNGIRLPKTGWYQVSQKMVFYNVPTNGVAICSIGDMNTANLIEGAGYRGYDNGWCDAICTGNGYFGAGTVLSPWYYSEAAPSLAGHRAYMYISYQGA